MQARLLFNADMDEVKRARELDQDEALKWNRVSKHLRTELEATAERCTQLEAALAEKDAACEQLGQQEREWKAQLMRVQQELRATSDQTAALEAEARMSLGAKEVIEQRVAGLEASFELARQSAYSFQQDADRLRELEHTALCELDQERSRSQKLEEQLSNAREELADMRAVNDALEQDLESAHQRANQSMSDAQVSAALEAELKIAEARLQQECLDTKSLREELDAVRFELAEAVHTKADLVLEHSRTSEALQDLMERLETLMTSKTNADALCQQRQAQVEALEVSLMASKVNAKLELERAQAASTALEDDLKVARSELSDLVSAREQLLRAQKEAASLQQAVTEVSKRAGSSEEQVALLQIEAAASAKLNASRIASLEIALQKSSDELAELRALKHGMESLQAVFAEAEGAMRAQQALHDRHEAELRSETAVLRSELEALQRERGSKEAELNAQVDALRNNRERLLQETAVHVEDLQANVARLTAKLEAVEAASDVKQLELLSQIDSLQRAQGLVESERALLDSKWRAEIDSLRTSRDMAQQESAKLQAAMQVSVEALRAELNEARASKELLSREHAEELRQLLDSAKIERVRRIHACPLRGHHFGTPNQLVP